MIHVWVISVFTGLYMGLYFFEMKLFIKVKTLLKQGLSYYAKKIRCFSSLIYILSSLPTRKIHY